MKGRRLRRREGESGQALVEFALVLPILILLLLAIVDFAKVSNYWNDENDMANRAARYAAVGRNPCVNPSPPTECSGSTNLADFIKKQADSDELRTGSAGPGVLSPGAVVCIAYTNSPARVGVDAVKVTVTSQYKWLSIIGSAVGIQKEIAGRADMRLERVPPTTDAGITGCST